MSRLDLGITFQNCSKSTRGDTCAGSCCVQAAGGGINYAQCVTKARCDNPSGIISSISYQPCEKDGDGNICANKCCGNYTQFNIVSCESAAMCNGMYLPALVAKSQTSIMDNLNSTVSNQLPTPTVVAISVLTSFSVIGLVALFVILYKYLKVKKELDRVKREGYYTRKDEDISVKANQTIQVLGDKSPTRKYKRYNPQKSTRDQKRKV